MMKKVKGKKLMEEILEKLRLKITTMRATLVQLDQYGIHHDSINVIRHEMHFYITLLEMLEKDSDKNGKVKK